MKIEGSPLGSVRVTELAGQPPISSSSTIQSGLHHRGPSSPFVCPASRDSRLQLCFTPLTPGKPLLLSGLKHSSCSLSPIRFLPNTLRRRGRLYTTILHKSIEGKMKPFCFHSYLFIFNQKFGGFINYLGVVQMHTQKSNSFLQSALGESSFMQYKLMTSACPLDLGYCSHRVLCHHIQQSLDVIQRLAAFIFISASIHQLIHPESFSVSSR